ncbi:MAG: alginate export family protein [Candidatus Kaistia colombiensis]|nr:MAG: alginate export family protein [Kaistia sp.]
MLLGEISAFPVLYKDNRSLLTAIVGAGFGGYSDLNAWFGNPQLFNAHNLLAGHLPGKSTAWAEGYAELGLGGASQLWGSPYYAFGALTGLFSWSLGQDIFRDDPRGFLDFEKAYAGLLYVDPENRKNNLKLSIGRQSYTLNDGFLINAVKGSTNAGDRGGLYLGPRLTNDFSVLAQGNSGAWSYNVFYIDPNELEQLESDTTFLGANLKYRFGDDISADATFVTIPTSKSTYANPFGLKLEREGLNTIAGHGLWANAFKLPGVWLEAEAAHQFHPDQDISAWAYYGTVGYIAKSTAWTPSLSYRYAYFSGDDPTTRRYERFDPLLSTGLGVWLQGVSFGKIASNSNLQTQRLQFNVAPNDALNLTLDYYWLHAPELNNLGSNPALATLTSHDLGQEVALSARWSATKSLYVQALVSYAMPGAALRNIGAGSDWTTFQLSLYGGF